MNIAGFQSVSLIDFPDHIASIVFTQGCNFRCPYCHNPDLVLSNRQQMISQEEVLTFLKGRVGKIEGVVITGGEPTLQQDLESFIMRVRTMGLNIKLDSNGSSPQTLENLISKGLVDYVAMDIKAPLSRYQEISGYRGLVKNIRESQELLLQGRVPYEFRTTVVAGDLVQEDFCQIAQEVQGARRYVLQYFVPNNTQDPRYMARKAPSEEMMTMYQKELQKTVQEVMVY